MKHRAELKDLLAYPLPEERIAQRPVVTGDSLLRDRCKLLVVEKSRAGLSIKSDLFSSLAKYLTPKDLLVLNDTAVRRCRFFANHPRDGREVEFLLLRKLAAGEVLAEDFQGLPGKEYELWAALARPLRKIQAGDRFMLASNLEARAIRRDHTGEQIIIALTTGEGVAVTVEEQLELTGLMPIPPYIRGGRSDEEDRGDYQTVFSKAKGSVAAPTAGLHFTEKLLKELHQAGVDIAFLTLHLGPASFRGITDNDLIRRELSLERYSVPGETKEAILRTKRAGGSVVAVGTTVVRALESDALKSTLNNGDDESTKDADSFCETKLLIQPGFEFQVCDSLITNFHQPGSSHLCLVSAFIGIEETSAIYKHGLANDYRFLSYGDAMLLKHSGGGG